MSIDDRSGDEKDRKGHITGSGAAKSGDSSVSGVGKRTITGSGSVGVEGNPIDIAATGHIQFSGSATLTDANEVRTVARAYAAREGYTVSGPYVVATAESTIQAFQAAAAELRTLIRLLKQQPPDEAEPEWRMVTLALSGLTAILEEGALQLGLAHDSRNWLRKIHDEHPEIATTINVAAGLATIGALLLAL